MSQFFSSLDRNRHKSSVQTKSELSTSNNGYIGKELTNPEQINVLSAMQVGTKLLKLCARRTRSHWRKFQLDSSNTKIRWVSDKKDVNDTTIYIANIIEIICDSIDIVKKFKDTLPEELTHNYESLQQQQFTIRYLEHNKNLTPNQLHLYNNQSLSNIIGPNNNHTAKHSNSSFIRTLPLRNKQMALVQPDIIDIDESITNNTNNTNNGGSFWKNLLKNNKNNKNNKKQIEEDIIDHNNHHAHERIHTGTDSGGNSNSNTNNYHICELHLMSEKPIIKSVWIYGLERLIELHSRGINLSLIPVSQFKISNKELMHHIHLLNNRLQLNDKELQQFKTHLEEINDLLCSIVSDIPNAQKEILLENNDQKMDNYDNNYLIKKIRQDQNDLDYILHQCSKSRFDKENLKRWSYILTRIEINCGGYQIAINNQKYNDKYNIYDNNNKHERKRSKSSSIYSLNYGVNSPFTLQQQYSNSNIKYQRNTILKNRSPRNNNNTISNTVSSSSSNNFPSPKYDSV